MEPLTPQQPNQDGNPTIQPSNPPAPQPQVFRPTGSQPVEPSPTNPVVSAEPVAQTGIISGNSDGSISSAGSMNQASPMPVSMGGKSFMVTFLLSLLLGAFGADRYYLGKIKSGLLKMFTLGGLLIWATVDMVLILANKTKDKDGNSLEGYEENRKTALIIAVVGMVLIVISGLFTIYAVSQAVKSVSKTVSSVADLAKDCPNGTCTADTSNDPAVTQLNDNVDGTGDAANLSVSIPSVDVSPKTTGDAADTGKKYVEVNFVIANSGSSDKPLPGMFYYRTPDGKLFNDTSTLSNEPTNSAKNVKLADPYMINLSGVSSMKKGEVNANYYLIFQVPKGDLGQVVWFSKAFDTNGAKLAIFNLK